MKWEVIMEKNFTIEAEVRLFAHWNIPATPEEKEKVNDVPSQSIWDTINLNTKRDFW